MVRILFVLALLLGAAACGDDDDAATEPVTGGVDDTAAVDDTDDLDDPQGADDDLINAVEAYALTQIEGDPDEITAARSQGCANVETGLDAGPTGGDGETPTVSDVEAEVDGEEATVSYRLDPAGTEVVDERWVKEDGEWKWDNC